MIRAAIKSVTSYLPANTLTNEQLEREFEGTSADKILDKTGIAVRHVSAQGECASDLGVAAAQKLFDAGHCLPADIDFLLLCTQTPDYYLPTTACTMQSRLGLRTDCGAVDFNMGCSGYIYGLAFAKSLIEAGTAAKVLLITSDTYTKLINPRDATLKMLFGDGAAATLVVGVESEREMIGPFVFGTDGRGANDLMVPAGGLRQPVDDAARVERVDDSGNWRSDCNLFMNSGAVFNFAMMTVPKTVDDLMTKWGRDISDVDYFIPHQANRFMLDRLRAKMRIPADKFFSDMKETGNTVSSTIPIAYEMAMDRGFISR